MLEPDWGLVPEPELELDPEPALVLVLALEGADLGVLGALATSAVAVPGSGAKGLRALPPRW